MIRLKVKGLVEVKGEITTRTGSDGREWKNQTLVLDVTDANGKYHDKIAMTVGDRTMEDVAAIQVGDTVEADVSVRSREWNGRWFNNLDLLQIVPVAAAPAQPESKPDADLFDDGEDDLPFS